MFKKSIAVLCALSLVFSQCLIINVTAVADKTAPTLKLATPSNGKTGIARNVKISIKYSEKLYKGKYFAKIKLVKSSNKKTVSIKRSVYKNYLKISHSLLAYNSYYVLTISAYALKDKAGNYIKKTRTIKFKTKAKPPVITTYNVGTDITAGEYVITGANAFWYVASDTSGSFESFITAGSSNTYLTVDAGTYLSIQDGTLTPIATAPVFTPVNGKFTDGMYKIGRDLPAGEYDIVSNSDLSMYAICKDSYCVESSKVGETEIITGTDRITLSDGQYIVFMGAYLVVEVV